MRAGGQELRLIAIDRAGEGGRSSIALSLPWQSGRRAALAMTCAADGTAAILDSVDWANIPVALEPDVVVNQLLLSPNRKQALPQHNLPGLYSLCYWPKIPDCRSAHWGAIPGLKVLWDRHEMMDLIVRLGCSGGAPMGCIFATWANDRTPLLLD